MQDFEKLGAFYVGNTYDLAAGADTDELVLYDSKDLTTHAVIIGMTGSGKTGLGIGLLEEAAIDKVPVIAIDPKGDMGNLLLNFPDFRASDFEPWVDPQAAANQGQTVAQFANAQAQLWKKGLAKSGQDGSRLAKLRESAEANIYTPGSSAGIPISVLESFNAPPAALRDDTDLYRQRIQSTATSILALAGLEADPITSREHILIANILDRFWEEGRGLDLGGLIAAIQQPPIKRIGVMDLDSFFAPKDRFALAMRLNNLLAAPGFEAWMEGVPLDAKSLLYTDEGKPRLSVMSIAHLADSERMFFVSMLLNEIISWMRAQPGTGSLRAILYMDEIFGYMPPTANPPSKNLFLTLLKQARAYGLGLVLSTQNPVDLDYKGLSNTGTWFIGRLQTERDKMRVMEGLEGAAAGGEFDRQKMEQTLAGLGKRKFLLHNVHEDGPVVFHTRWAMSYLAGPLTRDQIRKLMHEKKAEAPAAKVREAVAGKPPESTPPPLPSAVTQYFLPTKGGDSGIVYEPILVGAADVVYSSARYKVETDRRMLFGVEIEDSAVPVEWEEAEPLAINLDDLEDEPLDGADFGECPEPALEAKNYTSWEKQFKHYVRTEQVLTLYKCPTLKVSSNVDETEGDFRVRLQQIANEKRDVQAAKLRKRYASKLNTLEERKRKAEQVMEREAEQAKQRKFDTVISVGSALLGTLLGRKKLSSTTASKIGTAARSAGRMRKEAGDVKRAEETILATQAQIDELAEQMQAEIDALDTVYNAQEEELTPIVIKPKSTDIQIHFVGLLWQPYREDAKGRLRPA